MSRFFSVKEAALIWGVTERTVRGYCKNKMIDGAVYVKGEWAIPEYAERPFSGRAFAAEKRAINSRYKFPLLIYTPDYMGGEALNFAENSLLTAQIAYMQYNFVTASVLCKKILKRFNEPYIQMGAYYVLAMSALLSGMPEEYARCFSLAEELMQADAVHSADFKLILLDMSLAAGDGKYPRTEFDIATERRLSGDAIPFGLMYSVVSGISEDADGTRIDMSLAELGCAHSDKLGLPPVSLMLHAFSAVHYKLAGERDNVDFHLESAIDTAVSSGWITPLIRIEAFLPEDMERLLNKRNRLLWLKVKGASANNVLIKKLSELRERDDEAFSPLSDEQKKLIPLLCSDITLKDISMLLRISFGVLKKQADCIFRLLGVDDREGLRAYFNRAINRRK